MALLDGSGILRDFRRFEKGFSGKLGKAAGGEAGQSGRTRSMVTCMAKPARLPAISASAHFRAKTSSQHNVTPIQNSETIAAISRIIFGNKPAIVYFLLR
jgi:hypothetical protein